MDTITTFKGKNEFLSNFFFTPIVYEGITFPTSEHAFQAAKTLDLGERQRIANLTKPGQAKYAGKRVQLREGWNQIRTSIMQTILQIKFSHPTLKQALLDTGTASLVEGNSWNDTFWGVCKGKEQNHLGRLLEKIRSELSSLEIANDKESLAKPEQQGAGTAPLRR